MLDWFLPKFGYFFIRVGSGESTRWERDTIYIKRVTIIYPEYSETTQNNIINDIALKELNEDLKYKDWIQPIQLADESFDVLENLTVKIAAYGQTCDTCSASGHLLEVVLSTCVPLYETENVNIYFECNLSISVNFGHGMGIN